MNVNEWKIIFDPSVDTHAIRTSGEFTTNRKMQKMTSERNKSPVVGLGLTLTCSTTVSNCVIYAFRYEKVKTMECSETIAACYLKDGRCIQLTELMKVCGYTRSMSSPDLGPGSSTHKIKTCSETTGPFLFRFCM